MYLFYPGFPLESRVETDFFFGGGGGENWFQGTRNRNGRIKRFKDAFIDQATNRINKLESTGTF